MQANERYAGFDILKCLCCLMVVNIHFGVADSAGWALVQNLSRIGVPCFLMITGFFLEDMFRSEGRIERYLKKILVITAVAFSVNMAWDILIALRDGNLNQFLTELFSFTTVRNLLFWGYSYRVGHLWYMYALFFDIFLLKVAFGLLKMVNVRRRQVETMMAVYVICMWALFMYLERSGVAYYICRSYLIFSMPFILVGYFIKRYLKDVALKRYCASFTILLLVVLVYVEQSRYQDMVMPDFSLPVAALSILLLLLFVNVNKAVIAHPGG